MNYDAYTIASLVTPRRKVLPAAMGDQPRRPETAPGIERSQFAAMTAPENVARAWDRVRKNNGAPGMDGVTVAALKPVFSEAWGRTLAALEAGDYRPLPVRRVEVPKPAGGTRLLGIPAVMDRVVQQALAQVLAPDWEARFSPASYAYRPGRGAHDALAAAVQWLEAGGAWAAQLDIEKFFDRVDHGRLVERLGATGLDARLVELIRQFLAAGAVSGGVWEDTPQGTPQGSPLSPLLANIVLDGLDRRLEALGARHVRYADDVLILGRTRTETEAMVENAAAYLLAELNLRLNEGKTRLTPAPEAEFLGFRFRRLADGRWQRVIAPAAQEAFRGQVNALTEYRPGVAPEAMLAEVCRFVRGWRCYFTVPGQPWAADQFQSHARARVRRWLWQSWSTPERRAAELTAGGLDAAAAQRASTLEADAPQLTAVLGQAVPNAWFERCGLSHPVRRKNDSHQAHAQHPAAGPRQARHYPPYPGGHSQPRQAETRPPQRTAPTASATAPTGKRRGWFFNFSLGRLFTFRFLSENAPGVLTRPERRPDTTR